MVEKILIDGRLLSNKPTGISRYSEQLIKAFKSKYGNDRIFIIVNPEYSPSDDGNFIITGLRPYNPLHFLLFSFFINFHHFDLYYSPFYSGIYFKIGKRKQAVTVHDLMYSRIENYFSKSSFRNYFSKIIFNLLVKSTLRSSDQVISVSETTRKDLREFFNIDAVVIGEGVNDLSEAKSKDELIRADLQTILKNKYFLYVGNFRKQKNISFLIQAFLNSHSNHQLVLAGDRNGEPVISSDHENIIFTGALADHEIYHLYKNCLAFVMPSFYEGFGLPILEAYCAGARILASDQGALTEFKEMNIHYFSPYHINELINLLKGVEHLSKPSELQIESVRKVYSWEKQTDKILQIVDNLCQS